MYTKPEVRIVEPQQEQTSSVDVYGYEAQALLAKYGFSQNPVQNINPDSNLTFEELISKEMERKEIQKKQNCGPMPYSFDPNKIGYSESKYASIEGQDIGITIQIVSDMPIFRENRF